MDARAQGWALNVPAWLDDLPATVEAAARVRDLARAQSAIGDLPYALSYLAQAQLALGRWAEAYASAEEYASVCMETGTRRPIWCTASPCYAQIEAATR